MSTTRIQAVFLDIGGTVADPDPSFHGIIARVCTAAGLTVGVEDVGRVEPIVWAELEAQGLSYPLTAEASSHFWRTAYRLFGQHLGAPAREELAEQLSNAFIDLRNWRLYPDAGEAIATLRARGYRLVAVSNWEGWLERLLEHLGVLPHFDVVLSSTRAGVAKPDPRIYQLALAEAGLRPEQVVHVGDSPTYDAAPAEAVGITPVLVDRLGRYPSFAGLRLVDLRALPDLIARTDHSA